MAFGGIGSEIVSSIANSISSLVTFIAQNAEYIIAIIGGIGTAIAIMIVPKIVSMIEYILIATSAWALMNLPILLIGAAVVALLVLFLKFPGVFGTIVGAAAAAGEMIINTFKAVYNVVASVLNVLIKAINLIPGVNVPEIKMLEYKNLKDVYNTGKDWVVGGSNALSEKISNIGGIFTNKGASNYSTTGLEANQLSNIGSGIDGLNDKLSGSGSLKSVGETEIKTDNLKWLLDISSRKYQEEYQKAPIYVNVSTGDINSGTDESRLLRKLEDSIINAYNENLVVV